MSLAAHYGSVTWDDVQALPPDGRRYESIGGALVVTPSPNYRHQKAVGNLYSLLKAAAPPDLDVVVAPFDWFVSQTEWYESDVIVMWKSDAIPDGPLRATPVLACEVTSPSTRLIAYNLKRDAYAANGCPHYWIIDPEVPTLLALALAGGTYGEVGSVSGADVFRATYPFPVEVCPAELVAL